MPWSKNPLSYPEYIRKIQDACLTGHAPLIQRHTRNAALQLRNEYGAYVRALEHAAAKASGDMSARLRYQQQADLARAVTCYIADDDGRRNNHGTCVLFQLRDHTPKALDIERQLTQQAPSVRIEGGVPEHSPLLDFSLDPTGRPKA